MCLACLERIGQRVQYKSLPVPNFVVAETGLGTTWWFGSCETWSRPANRVGPSARPPYFGPEREKKNRKTQRRTQKKIDAKVWTMNRPLKIEPGARLAHTHGIVSTRRLFGGEGIKGKTNLSQQARGATDHMLTIKGHAALDWPAASMLPPGKPQTSCVSQSGWHPRGFRAIDWA